MLTMHDQDGWNGAGLQVAPTDTRSRMVLLVNVHACGVVTNRRARQMENNARLKKLRGPAPARLPSLHSNDTEEM